MAEAAPHNPLSPTHLFNHVQDSNYIQVPAFLHPPDGKISLTGEKTIEQGNFEGYHFQFTKFMLLESIVAITIALVFIRLANKMKRSDAPRGRWWNLLETMIVYIRDEVATPAIGHHDARRFMPFLWTMFFFILGCNVFGLLPWAGSPTASLSCTAALALVAICVTFGTGIAKFGLLGYLKAQVPHLEMPFALKILMLPMIFCIEVIGIFIKHGVLAIRLLANMLAGHLVLAVILAFIAATAETILWVGVTPISVVGAATLSLLELLVAFIQAYVFTFLSALFIGMAAHPH
jgi:F-type H+-transporting ATPase subunit a